MSATTHDEPYDGALSLYFATAPGELADLEVAASAAIEWAKGLKAAAAIVDPDAEYRVSLIVAKPGSSNWLAKIERSTPNQTIKRVQKGWQKVPLILRLGLGLAVVVPTTAKPTIDYWLGNDGFSETEKRELEEIVQNASDQPSVKQHRKRMYRTAPQDPKITGIGTGIPDSDDWKPTALVPANRFAEAEGLFEVQDDPAQSERTIEQTLDVILVTPRLENARRAWTFRQEGLPGTFNAEMHDTRFLGALDRTGGIKETLRANIPMRIVLEIKQEKVAGEWRVKRRGRSVVRVISPVAD